jgi:aspartate/methionine/tyrosine aminotransferase
MSLANTLARPLATRVKTLPDPIAPDSTSSFNEGVANAAAKAMTDGHTHYTDRPGILPLRQNVVNSLGARYGIEMSADEVTITCGVIEGRFVALKQLVPAGSTVLALTPSPIAAAAQLIGAEATTDVNAENIVMVFLTPADNPTQRDAILEQAAAKGWWILWDMGAFSSDENFHPAQNPALAAKTITLGEISELAGWRVGWLAGSSAANKLRAFKQSMTICTTSVSQWAALGLKGS